MPGLGSPCSAAIVRAAWQRRAGERSERAARRAAIVRYWTLIERFSVGLGVTPAPLNVMITFGSTPTGVPGLLGPLPPPPPHEAIAASAAIARIAHAMLQLRRPTVPARTEKISANKAQASAKISPNFHPSNLAGPLTNCGGALEAAVV